MVRLTVLCALLVLTAAACGSASHPTQAAAAKAKTCTARAASIAKIHADIAALQKASTDSAVNHATDRFLLDVDTAPISNLLRNRLIDHAAAAVTTKCPQCFQAMEAERPIPAIAHGDTGCGSS